MKSADSLLDIVRELFPFHHSVVSDDSPMVAEKLRQYLPFEVSAFPSGAEVNGWKVPDNWRPVTARIMSNGRVFFDALSHPLGVGQLSPTFVGSIERKTLLEHLFFSERNPKATPYHWANLYRPAETDWAICMPKTIYDQLPDEDLSVELITEKEPGEMLVLDYFLPGDSPKTVLLNAHNCHPWQANDDLSGCAVGISALQELLSRKKRKFSYRLLIAPELIGPVHWLNQQNLKENPIIGAIMLKAVGNFSALKLQSSFSGESELDKAAHMVFDDRFGSYGSGGFREIYGNDETVFDSPGFEIPSISLTRYPFAEYHTDADTPEALSPASLEETKSILLEIIDVLENDRKLRFAHRGLVSLSNPKYNLYMPAPAPGLDKETYQEVQRRWNLLMNCLPRELNGENSIVDIADKYSIPFFDVHKYLLEWEQKGLATEDYFENKD